MNDGRAGLVVFGLGDPHLLEGGERSEDGASDPDGVLALRGSDDLDLHGAERIPIHTTSRQRLPC